MKVRVEIEVDLVSGNYDVRFHNLSEPGEAIDVVRVSKVAHRVLDNVNQAAPETEAAVALTFKADLN